jgi:hypothetical protein
MAGLHLRDEMLRRMYATPPEMLDLSIEDLAALRDGVTRVPLASGSPTLKATRRA